MMMEKLVRPREVACQLAVSRSTVYRWFWEGKLRGVRLKTGSLRIIAASVEAMVGEVW
ncbi:helix-turn-helix domain-containing protein [Desulfobacca acetoxidans]|uniref:Resolvase related protein n=1 Tax=Desulfobacca acetoxidans (strain ATCC 700848 / DSM 11109 / ASRB2) TaxID=880072 RepID=F2NCQ4_DESAR|nr:resolvase related protein [Desulfobacca acetoxidans DSM 11109]HAY22465.1 helix-turn-helix domain-containing protein [Desulfobacterales bacterium]